MESSRNASGRNQFFIDKWTFYQLASKGKMFFWIYEEVRWLSQSSCGMVLESFKNGKENRFYRRYTAYILMTYLLLNSESVVCLCSHRSKIWLSVLFGLLRSYTIRKRKNYCVMKVTTLNFQESQQHFVKSLVDKMLHELL